MDYIGKIKETYLKMLDERIIRTEEEINGYYENFREKFRPEKLESLDGETLLNTMFNTGNRDSLVYWLEFKNDDEFHTNEFGGIGGGSALKFSIFRRKEDEKWITGSTKSMKELSINEAIDFARNMRDLLVNGSEVIASMPDSYDDTTYTKLNDDLYKQTNTYSNTSWLHKYYHMIFPERIDTFYSNRFQKFYIIKLRQVPSDSEKRYVLTGHYTRLAKQLDMKMYHLFSVLWKMFGSPHGYWRIGTTEKDGANSFWDEMKNGGHVSIGWPELGDISQFDYSNESKAKDELKKLLEQKYERVPQSSSRSANQILMFVNRIKPDDIVVAVRGETVLGIGKVIGQFEYNTGFSNPHIRKVQWLHIGEFKLPNPSEGKLNTVYSYKDTENLVAIEEKIDSIKVPPPTEGIIAKMDDILKRKRQVILYGPPGTGKTYWAEKACFELASRKAFGETYDDLSDSEKRVINGKDGLVRMCCFHPSYSYEDFIEGIKPSVSNGQTVFYLKQGIFKILCNDAEGNPSKNYYLIIDEINRGDISRIFGELVTIIEKEKRRKQVILPLSGDVFSIPDNVYIVGTMNTADRSIALLDIAIRRRFGFIELMSNTELLGDVVIEGLPLALWLRELNRRICDKVGRDARNLQIGHSYLMENGKVITDFYRFSKVIQEDVIPLIEEYCYNDYKTIAEIIGKGLVDEENRVIKHELFEPSRKSELISALIQPCPDIASSHIAQTDEQTENDDLESGDSES